MSTDPYHAVQTEIQGSLQAAVAVRASYVRIRNMRGEEDGEELIWARNELKGLLTALEADLEDLEESVKIVESTDARLFGLNDGEVKERRRYVVYVRGEIENMRAEVLAAVRPPLVPRAQSPVGGGYEEEGDHQGEWAREEQQMMIREQDRTIDSISGTLSTLAQQAGIMGQEIEEHNEMLDDVESGVDSADMKLSEAMRKMRKFLRETEEKKSGWSNVSSSAKSASTATFFTALVFNSAVFAVEIALFTFIRPLFNFIYEPRTRLHSNPIQPLSASVFAWPIALYKADYRVIAKANGLDAYFFVRFLRMMTRILLPIWFLSWAILLPVTSINTSVPGNTRLNRFIFGNVAVDKQARYAAHLILVYIFTFWIFWNIRKEMKHFIITRQRHLIDPVHAKSVQANTLLVTGIPARYLSEAALTQLFSHLPGGVKKIWLNHDLKELPDVYDRRLAACNKLESAETSLLSTAASLRLKADKAALKSQSPTEPAPVADSERGLTLAATLVPRDKRPTHRLSLSFMPFSLPLVGQVVDSIEWSREEIRICNEILEKGREALQKEASGLGEDDAEGTGSVNDKGKSKSKMMYPPLNSAFVTFHHQLAAHVGRQVLVHHEPYRMSGRFTEVSPEDVIWGNLNMNPYEMKVRMVISYSITAALIILWAIPVAFIGAVSNIHSLCSTYKWLAWLCTLPSPIVGIISGILPPVMLAVLMMLLPIILRLLGRFEGIPKKTGLELSLMTRYFIFQVIHSFLIVTLSSGIISSLPGLSKNPSSIPSLLAQHLPQASVFFLTYIMLQGLTGTASGFLQVVPLALYYVKLVLLGSTPRSVHTIKYSLSSVAWGTLFPNITLLVVITLGYAIIAPIINGLACATFFLFYQLYKYLFLWQYKQPASGDTGGLFFPKAMQHLFVGMYVQQLCLCALFFLAQDENKKPSAVAEGALMVVLIVLTAFFHIIINNSYGPLLHALPLSLADKSYHDDVDSVPNEEAQTGAGTSKDDSADVARDSESLDEVPREKQSGEQSADKGGFGIQQEFPLGEEDEGKYGFAHPAASRPQQVVWLPQDRLGLGEEEEGACREAGVDASVAGAVMDEQGKVEVTQPPPL